VRIQGAPHNADTVLRRPAEERLVQRLRR